MSTIKIPGCSESLVLEPCEVAWAARETSLRFLSETCSLGHERVDDEMFAAVYECTLRDAIIIYMPDGYLQIQEGVGRVDLALVFPFRAPEVAHLFADTRATPFTVTEPTRLHALRAAAQYLKVGPWGTD